jgi:hypothetical protein
MASRDTRDEQRLDQVDRRSQVNVSRAMRARDVSRPDPTALAEALEKLESSGVQRFKPVETPSLTLETQPTQAAEEAPPTPRTDRR